MSIENERMIGTHPPEPLHSQSHQSLGQIMMELANSNTATRLAISTLALSSIVGTSPALTEPVKASSINTSAAACMKKPLVPL